MNLHALWIALGATILILTLLDAVGTLVTTRARKSRWWPTNCFYRYSWLAWRQSGLRMRDEDRRERALTAYGPVSLLFLLTIWIGLEIIGWGLVWYGMRDQFNAIGSPTDAWYFAGINFFTVGFGDIVPVETPARILTAIAAFTGITTSALVIGYLPTLYGAYTRREQQLQLLDDLSGKEVTPIGLIATYGRADDLSGLETLLEQWEAWVADVMESHTAFRMLVLFRSRRTGQSWLTALGVLTDTAVTLLACVRGAGSREPLLFYRRSTELLDNLTPQLTTTPTHEGLSTLSEEDFHRRYDHLAALGFSLRSYDRAWTTMQQLRAAYVPQLSTLATVLLAPRAFRNPEVRYPEVLAELAAEAEEQGESGASPTT